MVLAQAAVQVLAVPLAAQVLVPVVQPQVLVPQVLVPQVPPQLVLPLQRQQPWVWWLLVWRLPPWWLQRWPRRPTPSTQPPLRCLVPPPFTPPLASPTADPFGLVKNAPSWGVFLCPASTNVNASNPLSMPDWPLRLLGALSGLAMLTGCVGINPTLDMISTMLPGKDPALMVARGHEYVLIEIDGRKTAMALGLRQEVIESGQLRVHEHWYSGQREMIHMVNGRIHTALGLTVEWRRQRSSPPSWAAVSDAKATMPWTRELDVMPGYRFGQVDRIETQTSKPPQAAPTLAAGTQWFSDQVRSPQPLGGDWVYQQHFAVHQGRVVYSEQCLSPSVCFKFKHLGLIQ